MKLSNAPWQTKHDIDVYDSDGENIVAKTTNKTDARLCAAAPEMLAVLELLLKDQFAGVHQIRINLISQVVAKARGEK